MEKLKKDRRRMPNNYEFDYDEKIAREKLKKNKKGTWYDWKNAWGADKYGLVYRGKDNRINFVDDTNNGFSYSLPKNKRLYSDYDKI